MFHLPRNLFFFFSVTKNSDRYIRIDQCDSVSVFVHQGWVSKHDLSAETIDYPEKVFYRGQVVKCRVIKNRRDDGKLKLSFRVSERSTLWNTCP